MKNLYLFLLLALATIGGSYAGTRLAAFPTQMVEDTFSKPRKAIPQPVDDTYDHWRSFWWGQFSEFGEKTTAPDAAFSENARKAYDFISDIYYNKKGAWALGNASTVANQAAKRADSVAQVMAAKREAKQAAQPKRPKHVVPKPATDSYDEWTAYWWGQFNTYKNRTLPPDNTYSETARQAYMAVASDFDKKGRSNSWTVWIIIGVLVPVGLALGIMGMNGFI